MVDTNVPIESRQFFRGWISFYDVFQDIYLFPFEFVNFLLQHFVGGF